MNINIHSHHLLAGAVACFTIHGAYNTPPSIWTGAVLVVGLFLTFGILTNHKSK